MRLAALLLLAAPAASAQAIDATCTWFRVVPEGFYDGPCEITWTDTGAEVAADAGAWTIVEQGRQGQWSSVTLNGQEGTRYEVDRTHYAHATRDLNEFLDVQER